MVESAAHPVDHVLPEQPIRPWALTFAHPLRFLFAAQSQVLSQVLGVVYRAIWTCPIKNTGTTVASGAKPSASAVQESASVPVTNNSRVHVVKFATLCSAFPAVCLPALARAWQTAALSAIIRV